MQAIDSIFYIVVLIMSVIIHEFAHGYVAYLCGDETARMQGRLTLNPLKHLDPIGSVIVPLFLIISHAGFMFGWAKPVPYNSHNLKNGRKGIVLVALAGVLANLFIAIIFGLLIHFGSLIGLPVFDPVSPHAFYKIAISIVLVNTVLAMFNILPIPPLDGSKVLFEFLPMRLRYIQAFLEQWGMFILLFFIIFLWQYFSPLVFFFFRILTGIH